MPKKRTLEEMRDEEEQAEGCVTKRWREDPTLIVVWDAGEVCFHRTEVKGAPPWKHMQAHTPMEQHIDFGEALCDTEDAVQLGDHDHMALAAIITREVTADDVHDSWVSHFQTARAWLDANRIRDNAPAETVYTRVCVIALPTIS